MGELSYENLQRALVDAQQPPSRAPGEFTIRELCVTRGVSEGVAHNRARRGLQEGWLEPVWAAIPDAWGSCQHRKAYKVVVAK